MIEAASCARDICCSPNHEQRSAACWGRAGPARYSRSIQLVGAAFERLTALATKGLLPARIAREVEIIIGEWSVVLRADPTAAQGRALELLEQLGAGVVDAEEQMADVDRSEEPQ